MRNSIIIMYTNAGNISGDAGSYQDDGGEES